MPRIAWSLIAVLAVLVAAVAAHFALIETSGDVVVLTTRAPDDSEHITRLWFVEHEGAAWVNAGSADAEWLGRIADKPEVRVALPTGVGQFRAVAVPAAREVILPLMAAKYGTADRWVRFMVGTEAVPVRLDPLDGASAR